MPDDEEQAVVAGAGAPCGACRTLRRRCVPNCVFAPYFTAEDFVAVHGVFGASNVSKMLERVELPEQRRVAAATLVEEAKARQRDPTFGRVSYLRILQEVNEKARAQVDEAREEIAREFGALAAAEPVDVAAAGAAVRVEARAQVDAALKHAREQDARLLGVRNANEARWRELHPQEGTGTGKHAGNGKGIDVTRHREPTLSEPTMLVLRAAKKRSSRPPGFPDERSHQQMSEASREEAMRSVQAPAAAPQQHLDSAGQHAGTGQPRHAGDVAAGSTPGQGSTSVLLDAMMQLSGAGDRQHQQHHLVAQHAENKHDITQEMMQLQELLDMAELARNPQIMKNDVMMEVGQWDAAAGVAREQDPMMMMQQIPANTWQHQDQEMPQQMEELAQTTGNMSQQFAWAQQYHDPAAVHHASPWHQQMAEAHQPAAASASQVASEQDMLLLLQQHQVAAAEGGACQSDNLAAQYDCTELTLGYGHLDMHQQVFAAGQVAEVQDMNSRHAAAAVHAEREMMQLGAGAQQQQYHQQQQHAQNGLDIALGNGHPDAETQAMLQELAAIVEQDGRTMMTQQDPDAAWLLEMLEQVEKASRPDLDKRLEIMSRQAEPRHAQKELGITLGNGHPDGSTQGNLQAQELSAMAEMQRKREMLMRQFVAAGHARDQKLEMLMRQFVAAGHARDQKLEMLMRQFVAAGRAREQELITQQVAAATQQQHPVAQQYSGTELDISLGQDHGHPYWHQPEVQVQQMLQEKQLPTVQQMLQEQQLADAVGFGMHQPNTTSVQQDAAYANGEHGGGAGATMAFLSPESAKDAPFLADQQPQPNGHQMGSSLLPLPPVLGQRHAQVSSNQQRTDGGDQGLNSDLAVYLHYESLSRHGTAGFSRGSAGPERR